MSPPFYDFYEKDIKKSILWWKLRTGSVPSQNLPGKTTTPKQEKKLPVKRQITVKSTPKRTQKNSLWINSPLDLPFFNYEGPMTKVAGTQTENTLFELRQPHTSYEDNWVPWRRQICCAMIKYYLPERIFL